MPRLPTLPSHVAAKFSHSSKLWFDNFLQWLKELRHFTYVYQFIIKDTDEPLDEEAPGAGSTSVLSAGASALGRVGCVALPVHEYVHQFEDLCIFLFNSFYGAKNPVPFLSLEFVDTAENCHLLIPWSFW